MTREVSSSPESYPRRLPIGAYDTTILTDAGERTFSPWDRYAHELLIRDKGQFQELRHAGEVLAFTLPAYDYSKLKLFFLSVLWRASVSTLPFFDRTYLGPHEERIRELLLAGDPGSADHYSVCLAMYRDKPDGVGMLHPHPTRFFGVNYYHMSVGPYVAYLKIDGRPTPDDFDECQLAASRPLIVYAREFATSKERSAMIKVATLHARPR